MKLIGHLLTCVILGTISALLIQHPIALITCPLIGILSDEIWFNDIWLIKRLWRKLRGRCPMCGGPWVKKPPTPLDIYSYSPTCRPCAKVLLAGRLYGAGNKKLRNMCEYRDQDTTRMSTGLSRQQSQRGRSSRSSLRQPQVLEARSQTRHHPNGCRQGTRAALANSERQNEAHVLL